MKDLMVEDKALLCKAITLMAEDIRKRNPEFEKIPVELIYNLYILKAEKLMKK